MKSQNDGKTRLQAVYKAFSLPFSPRVHALSHEPPCVGVLQ